MLKWNHGGDRTEVWEGSRELEWVICELDMAIILSSGSVRLFFEGMGWKVYLFFSKSYLS